MRMFPDVPVSIGLTHEDGDTYVTLEMFESHPGVRATGAGTEAMRRLLDLTDKHGLSVYLDPHPLDEGWSWDRLVRWYASFGFDFEEDAEYREESGNYWMQRLPHAKGARRPNPRGDTALRTDPELWEEVKASVLAGSKGGRPGQWSARKAQLAVAIYKQEGGGYVGPKSPANSLARWTRQKWRTKSGRPSLETGERYLPAAAIAALTPAEYAATTRAKRAGMKQRQQFVPQPEKVMQKVRPYRRRNSLAERGARLTRELRARPYRVLPVRRRNPDGASVDPAAGLSDEMRWLWASLNITTARARAEEMAYQQQGMLRDALEEAGWSDLAAELDDGADPSDIFPKVDAREPDWLESWAESAEQELMQFNAADAPSFLFFDGPKVVRNTWMIHFTDHASDIAYEGFTRGISDPMRLGLTTHFSDRSKEQPGYVFAFLPNAARRYGWEGRRPKYGKEAVIFRADAIVAYHNSDQEYQAISWGPEAEDIQKVYLSDDRQPGLEGNLPPREGISGEYNDYEDVTYFADFPTLAAYLDAPARRN